MLARALRPALLLLAPLTLTLACGDDANGGSHDYVTVDATPNSYRPVAVGSTATVHVKHQFVDTPDADCDSGCGGNMCGDTYLPIDSRVLEATCNVPDCETDSVRISSGEFDVHVRSQVPGTIGVHVVLATPDGTRFEAYTNVMFGTPTGLAVSYPDRTNPWTSEYVSLPGSAHVVCVDPVAADGTVLHADPGSITLDAGSLVVEPADVSTGGPPTRCDRIRTGDAPGTFSLTYAYGDLSTKEDVRVVDPTDVASVSLMTISDMLGETQTARGTDALDDATRVDTLWAQCFVGTIVAVTFETKEGSRGIANAATALEVAPHELATIDGYDHTGDSPFALVTAVQNGHGSVHAQVGSASTDAPLGASACDQTLEPADAGDDHASDAGSDAEADAGIDGG